MKQAWKAVEEAFASFWSGKENYCFQFHDTRAAMGATGSRRVFTAPHPSDFLVTHKGETFYAEVKSCEDKVSFKFSNIQPAQWSAARQVCAASGKYFFFLFSHSNQSWYKIPGTHLVQIQLDGKKSVKWAELLDFLWIPPH
jgi:penicillin-binding protein-related factor A (putative recombinase)